MGVEEPKLSLGGIIRREKLTLKMRGE